MSFHVGQKVVCISTDDGFDDDGSTAIWPDCIKVGTILTLRGIDPGYIPEYGVVGLVFEEFVDADDSPFLANCFRPVIERSTETGMAILRKVADDASKKRNLVTTR